MRIIQFTFVLCLGLGLSLTSIAQKAPEAKAGWKLGAQAYTFRLFTLDEALRKIDSCGLRNVEIFPGQTIGGGIDGKVDYKMSSEERAKLKALFKKYKITPTAFGVINAGSETEWAQIFEFAKDLGIKVINTEPDPAQYAYLIPMAEKNVIKLGIHNHPKPSRYWAPDSVLKYLTKSPYIGACVDLGHYVRSGLDPLESLAKFNGRIVSFHFKDVVPGPEEGKFHDVIWGQGKCRVADVIAEMKRLNFKGPISAEYEYNWENSAPEVAKSVEYFRKVYEEKK